jgi:hypothetical protein
VVVTEAWFQEAVRSFATGASTDARRVIFEAHGPAVVNAVVQLYTAAGESQDAIEQAARQLCACFDALAVDCGDPQTELTHIVGPMRRVAVACAAVADYVEARGKPGVVQ